MSRYVIVIITLIVTNSLSFWWGCKNSIQPPIVETKLETRTVIAPSEVIYKDRVKQITLKCPKVETTTTGITTLTPPTIPTYKPPGFKLQVLSEATNIKYPEQINIGIGWFLTPNLSVDLQTNLKFNTLNIGAAIYF